MLTRIGITCVKEDKSPPAAQLKPASSRSVSSTASSSSRPSSPGIFLSPDELRAGVIRCPFPRRPDGRLPSIALVQKRKQADSALPTQEPGFELSSKRTRTSQVVYIPTGESKTACKRDSHTQQAQDTSSDRSMGSNSTLSQRTMQTPSVLPATPQCSYESQLSDLGASQEQPSQVPGSKQVSRQQSGSLLRLTPLPVRAELNARPRRTSTMQSNQEPSCEEASSQELSRPAQESPSSQSQLTSLVTRAPRFGSQLVPQRQFALMDEPSQERSRASQDILSMLPPRRELCFRPEGAGSAPDRARACSHRANSQPRQDATANISAIMPKQDPELPGLSTREASHQTLAREGQRCLHPTVEPDTSIQDLHKRLHMSLPQTQSTSADVAVFDHFPQGEGQLEDPILSSLSLGQKQGTNPTSHKDRQLSQVVSGRTHETPVSGAFGTQNQLSKTGSLHASGQFSRQRNVSQSTRTTLRRFQSSLYQPASSHRLSMTNVSVENSQEEVGGHSTTHNQFWRPVMERNFVCDALTEDFLKAWDAVDDVAIATRLAMNYYDDLNRTCYRKFGPPKP